MNEEKAGSLVGGFRNAMERGTDLESVKKSFLNSGYSQKEVEAAAQEVSGIQISKLVGAASFAKEGISSTSMSNTPVSSFPKPVNGFFTKKRIIVFGVIASLVIVVALFLGLFWNKLF